MRILEKYDDSGKLLGSFASYSEEWDIVAQYINCLVYRTEWCNWKEK